MGIPVEHVEVITKACTMHYCPRRPSGWGQVMSTPARWLFSPAILGLSHQVSPSHQHRKAASFQNLHSLLSGKVDRSSLYLVGEPGAHSAAGR